jgi:hypothetical protein
MKNYLLKNIEPDLWQQVQILAAIRGVKIKQLIISLLSKEIDKEKKRGKI